MEELKCEAERLKQAMDCYDIDQDDEHLVTFPHPKASFTSTRTRELNRLSAPSYLNNTQHSKKKVIYFLTTQQPVLNEPSSQLLYFVSHINIFRKKLVKIR